jgi:hypothetical protein
VSLFLELHTEPEIVVAAHNLVVAHEIPVVVSGNLLHQ